ncbi:hypothetical protein N7462_007742 [Penicillium macrosclerotiorum]|uniref:uncharacterized protein n=1 Tax=Penicillium macrosclerotiorum TaxID=303699 RepID=UPI00254929F2|nr:uncharacterized protein N7462_007742 [Penicillium macrosclerotiorum]KAJ5679498.1 hypothetical protein N7462_007742 [Penicillium macrosclerotiorum]
MAYNAVAQVDEVASGSDSDDSRNTSPVQGHASFQQLRDADHLARSDLEAARTENNQGLGPLGSMIRSMTGTSYDVVEADDYVDPSPEEQASSLRRIPSPNIAVARQCSHSGPNHPLHSASPDIPIPLNHPTPDLQSRQGAYIGNVERLEQSAEQLSLSSADIGSEIRKMDQEQKRRSCSSASNSVVLRNGAFSPATIASHGSTFSTRQRSVSGASRLAQVAEPDHDEDSRYLDHLPAPLPILPAPQPTIYNPQPDDGLYYHPYDGPEQAQIAAHELERPNSAASGDTYQQARTLFTDFDGVHFAPLDFTEPGRQLSLSQPPLASKPESYKAPPAGEQMVYYPAPVPRMLNLPPKLSRKPIADREKRRTQLLTNIVAEDRKSAPWLAGSDQDKQKDHKEKRQSKIPAQLRASLFFDKPSTTLEVDVKHDSAVATLDSILDASANAPVSAFTDHPYAGHVGSYVFHQSKRKTLHKDSLRQKHERNSNIPMGQQHSTIRDDDDEGSVSSRDRSQREDDEHSHERSSDSEETDGDEHSLESEDEDDEYVDYMGPPNTLLAELELRKQELKQRRRTVLPSAAEAQGLQTTLLEMDAMAQKQSEKRRRRPVTLAWDGRDNGDDDDVPLAMLYPEQSNKDDDGRPLGLMARQQLEENEPLSTRRARLRGEPIPEKRPVTVYANDIPQPADPEAESGDEGETLAERMRRLRGQNPAESDFTSDLLAEFDNRAGNTPKQAQAAPAPQLVTNDDETLAQRRLRLQKENGVQGHTTRNPRMRQSMAALPQSRPAYIARQSSYDAFRPPTLMQSHQNRMSMQSFPISMGYQGQAGYPLGQQYSTGMQSPAAYAYNNMMTGVPGGMGYPMPGCGPNMTRQPAEPPQHDVIDRWRQSIR